jgi:hypothetical protein
MYDAGFPFEAIKKGDNNEMYPKLRGNEDYGPLHKLLCGHGKAMVQACGFNPEQEKAWTEVVECFISLDKQLKRDGCDTDAQKERCVCLGSQLILKFLAAGGQRKELSNYMLLLLFIGDFQPSQSNLCYLRMGHFRYCPKSWNVLQRPCNLKAADDEGIENGHRVWKQENTHNGGGKFVQHPDTNPADKMTRDKLGLHLRMQMHAVRLIEAVQQKVQLVGRTHSAPYKSVFVEWGEGQASILHVLEHFHDERGMQFRTCAELEASGMTAEYEALRLECSKATGLPVEYIESWMSSCKSGRKPYAAHPNQLLPQAVCLVKEKNTAADFYPAQQPKQKKARTASTGQQAALGQPQQQQQQQHAAASQPQGRKRSCSGGQGGEKEPASKKRKNNPRKRG